MSEKALPGFVERYCSLVDASLWRTSDGHLARPSLRAMSSRASQLGYEVSVPLLNKWRTVEVANPAAYYLVALSKMFEVPVTIWFDEADFTTELRRVTDREKRREPTLPSQDPWTTAAGE